MSKQTENYAVKKKRRLIIIAVCSAVLALIMAVGLVAAFYSDMLSSKNNITTGTLDIAGQYTFYVNGVEREIDTITNLNPGDVIVIQGNITNNGNKSAWIRDRIVIDSPALLPYFEAYEGSLTQAQIISGAFDDDLLTVSGAGVIITTNKVIDGTGTGAEIETGADYDYLNLATYTPSITLYFLTTAGNDTQNTNFDLTVYCQALQFRNNNTAEPDETAWSSVVALV